METKLLSKTNTLVNLSNSLFKFFDCNTYHNTMTDIDKILAKSGKRKVCLFLFDALGKVILEKYKKVAPYMYGHIFKTINSVWPATTVACTTSVLSGKYPLETGYLGWHQYFKEFNEVATTFTGEIKGSDKKLPQNPQESILKYKTIVDFINEKYGDGSAYSIQQHKFYRGHFKIRNSFKTWKKTIDEKLNSAKFIYAYSTCPDCLMHDYGTNHYKVKNVIRKINSIVKELTAKHPDVLFIAISDHGMIDAEHLNIETIPGFIDTLKTDKIIVESRFASFFVKDEKAFLNIYKNNEILNKNFALISKKDFLNKNIFGYVNKNDINPISTQSIGDYFLIAQNKLTLNDKYATHHLKGHHAGQMEDEYLISLQIYNN